MPSPAWRRWPRRAGCGGDPLRIRSGSVERQHPLIRVGGDAHIAPGPDGQDRWDDTYKPPALAPDLPGGCGHPPLRGWEVLPRNLARPILSCVPSTPAACGRHPLQAGEGRSCSYWAAGKSTGFPIHLGPVLWEGWVPLIRQGLWPCHLPRGGRRPPAGAARLRLRQILTFPPLLQPPEAQRFRGD